MLSRSLSQHLRSISKDPQTKTKDIATKRLKITLGGSPNHSKIDPGHLLRPPEDHFGTSRTSFWRADERKTNHDNTNSNCNNSNNINNNNNNNEFTRRSNGLRKRFARDMSDGAPPGTAPGAYPPQNQAVHVGIKRFALPS